MSDQTDDMVFTVAIRLEGAEIRNLMMEYNIDPFEIIRMECEGATNDLYERATEWMKERLNAKA